MTSQPTYVVYDRFKSGREIETEFPFRWQAEELFETASRIGVIEECRVYEQHGARGRPVLVWTRPK
jgi:hypothetical protein